ncbi:hypothetical protein HHL19_17435 [Streptomyces sp. R302]|uniref:hypothetical protein n=1 Tax=unclassified Streptomyces TaxID=2593676 RepID=UPI00145F6BFD|nr:MULTISPECIES: hypothetical protein [unclassified Streptomyces]NML52656.1 hypothetical protein [Streptomyces sp. R301]NML80415.1 hypothetical protein [Streptomyces sp. R302]
MGGETGLSIGIFVSPVASVSIAGAFAAHFTAAAAVLFLRGHRGASGLRRAYMFAFGWAQWL